MEQATRVFLDGATRFFFFFFEVRQLEREGAGSVFWFGEEAAIFFRGGELGFFWGRRGFFSFFFRGVLKVFLENVLRVAVTHTEHARRKTVTAMDVVYGLKRQGRTLYGFDG